MYVGVCGTHPIKTRPALLGLSSRGVAEAVILEFRVLTLVVAESCAETEKLSAFENASYVDKGNVRPRELTLLADI